MTKASAALGFAPHSGWAVAVGAAEVDRHLRVIVRERIDIADPDDPKSKQPYHSVAGLATGDAAPRLAAYAATAQQMAHEAVRRLVDELARRGHPTVGAGILESAGRRGSSLSAILASHALIHTADGEHFRSAIEGAATRCELPVVRVPARELHSRTAAETGTPIERLPLVLKDVGREMGPPWGADQKAAALLAWLVLAKASEGGERDDRVD